MKGAFKFGNKGNIRLLVSRNKEGGTGQLENKGKHMGYWLVAAKKRWCWSRKRSCRSGNNGNKDAAGPPKSKGDAGAPSGDSKSSSRRKKVIKLT